MKNLFTLLFFLSIVLFSCNTSKMTFNDGKKWIPAGFNPGDGIILVENFKISSRANNKMKEYMAKTYPYKFEFVDKNIILDSTGKYADKEIYKYSIMIYSRTLVDPSHTRVGGPGFIKSTGHDFYFFDRSTGTKYPVTKKPSSYAISTFMPFINTIVKNFEAKP